MMDWQLKPARDLGLSGRDRLRSLSREPGLPAAAIAFLWRRLLRGYLALFHGLRVSGAEHLPAPPFVLIANHASHLDALTLSAVLRGAAARRAFVLAAGDTFFTSLPMAAFAAHAINALPIWRRRTRSSDLTTLRTRLVEDRLVLVLFPEGTRSRDGAMARFQPGIGALIAGTTVPVVPCWIEGAFAAWPAQRRLPRPGPLSLRIGAPLRFETAENGRAGWEMVATACEAAVQGLVPGA